VGNTDAGFILGTGKLLIKVPPTMRFVLDGEMPEYLLAKDLILQVIGARRGCSAATAAACACVCAWRGWPGCLGSGCLGAGLGGGAGGRGLQSCMYERLAAGPLQHLAAACTSGGWARLTAGGGAR
jgi:hypothetical protein